MGRRHVLGGLCGVIIFHKSILLQRGTLLWNVHRGEHVVGRDMLRWCYMLLLSRDTGRHSRGVLVGKLREQACCNATPLAWLTVWE